MIFFSVEGPHYFYQGTKLNEIDIGKWTKARNRVIPANALLPHLILVQR